MVQPHLAIQNFLAAVHACKGTVGQLLIEAEFQPGDRGIRGRGSFASRSATRDGNTRPSSVKTEEDRTSSTVDGKLYLGEVVRFSLTVLRDGYLRLFNFGSGGKCSLLFPHHSAVSGQVSAGSRQHLPDAENWFEVTGPTTDNSGQPDRLFALWLAVPAIRSVADLDPRLKLRECGRGGPGFGAPRLERSPLFSLAPEEWDYGLLVYETML